MSKNAKTHKKGSLYPGISRIFHERVITAGEQRIEQMKGVILDTLSREEDKYFPLVAQYMNRSVKPNLEPFKKVRWRRLSKTTIFKKGNSRAWRSSDLGKRDSYFGGYQHLQDLLRVLPTWKYFPEAEVKTTKVKKHARGFSWHITVTPSTAQKRKRITDYKVTDYTGKTKTQESKITGRNRYTGDSNEEARPLFNPMAEYFVKHHLTRAINNALKEKLGYKRNKFTTN